MSAWRWFDQTSPSQPTWANCWQSMPEFDIKPKIQREALSACSLATNPKKSHSSNIGIQFYYLFFKVFTQIIRKIIGDKNELGDCIR
jgi:hypothetical protein